jgi:hypothetical protein
MEIQCQDCASYLANDDQLAKNQRKIKWVVAFSQLGSSIVQGYRLGIARRPF